MRVLYIHQYFKFPDQKGGSRSYDLGKSFVEEGRHVEVISSTFDKALKSKNARWTIVKREGIKVHYIYLPYDHHLSHYQRIVIFIRFLWHASFKALSINADVVLATSTPLTIGIPALIKKWRQKTPYIFEVRDVWPEAVIAIGAMKNRFFQRITLWLEKVLYEYADAIVPLSSDMKKSIISRYPKMQEKNITVIENIAEVNRFKNKVDPNIHLIKDRLGFKPRYSVLYAGTFGQVNGVSYLVDLASKTLELDPTIVYILIGNGVEFKKTVDIAKKTEVLNQNLFILDPVAKDDLPQLYFEVDMGSSFVIPILELWANSAQKFFDTLAAGRPILINYGGWQKNVIEHHNIGYVLPTALNDEAVHQFIEYTYNQELNETQKSNALNTAISNYSLEVATYKYREILSRTILKKSYIT